MISPNKHIRKAYINLLKTLNYPTFDKRVPPDFTFNPATYIIIQSQTKTENNVTKCNFDWRCSVTLDIYSHTARGFADTAILDDVEEMVMNRIYPEIGADIILLPDFICYYTKIEEPTDVPMETPTETILHRVLRFRHDIGQITNYIS